MKETFSNKLSTVLVAAGCSVGLGNIWRFPYVAGENGGAAFLLLYLLCIIIMGLPVMLSEFAMGRHTGLSAVGAYRQLGGRWASLIGYSGTLSAFLIMGFYYVVAGWTVEYFLFSVTGELAKYSEAADYGAIFSEFILNPWKPLIFSSAFVLINHLVIEMGVKKGLERVSNILMPLLFVILIVLAINSLMMPNSLEGVKFFLQPDFSKITPTVVLEAMGQAFFSLSIGLGALITYGAYIKKDTNLRSTAMQVTLLDTSVAIIAGFIIFPAAFSVGVSPGSGPALVFQTLPAIFNTLPFSMLWASIFFLLLIIAALTSTMSLHEVATVFMMEELGMTRRQGTYATSFIVLILSSIASLSLGSWDWFTIAGMSAFDFMDHMTANYLLPLGGLCGCIFVGWILKRSFYADEMTNYGDLKCRYLSLMFLMLKYICPILLFAVFLNSIGII